MTKPTTWWQDDCVCPNDCPLTVDINQKLCPHCQRHNIDLTNKVLALREALARWLPPDVVMAGDFMRRTRRDITLSDFDADCALLDEVPE